ncbi:MAG: Ig-like domain-containing protein, partial [Gemmatimonadetes bacterium]|nr:Ig-like domain-containing protein [Gemmatimonadota bacterium]
MGWIAIDQEIKVRIKIGGGMRRIRLTALLLLVACETPTAIPVATSVSISPTTLSFTAIGETATVVATVKDQNGAAMGVARVEWMTTDETVASISSEGPISSITVTAVGTGTATIVASSDPVGVTAGVTVVQEAASVELSSDSLTFLTLGDTTRLTATVRDENGNPIDDATVNWS